MVLQLVVHENFPYVLMGLCANFFFFQTFGPVFILKGRRIAFSAENLKKHEELHQQTFGAESKIDALGNPDQGQGWYSKTCSLKEWHAINTAQRITMNYLEHFPILIMFTIICSLFFTNIALVCVWAVFVGRIVYSFGYQKGP